MKGGFTISRLVCRRCGEDLPVLGNIVTFRCGVCGDCWIVSPEGLRRQAVYRAAVEDETGQDLLYLPYWVFTVDRAKLERSLLGQAARSAGTLSGSVPPRSEIERLVKGLCSGADYNVYVPCFPEADPMAHLEAGRLMTREQPSFHAEKTDSPGPSPACTLLPGKAAAIIDYIFLSVLPERLRMSAGFLDGLRLSSPSAPALVEFPFERSGASLRSLIGGFNLPARAAASGTVS